MATTPRTAYEPSGRRPERPAGEGQAPSLDALHPHGRVRATTRCPIIVRGEGCYVYDEHGKRYLDGLSALFCVNAGHGRAELGEAAAAPDQGARLLHELELRAPARDRAGRAHRRRSPPGTSTGCSSPPAAPRRSSPPGSWPGPTTGSAATPAHEDHLARDWPTTAPRSGALSVTGITALRTPFEPLTPGGCHVPNTNTYRWPEDRDPLWAADAIEERIKFEGPETVAAVILEPVQNAGGCFMPQDGYFQRVREICDKHGVLLISDEVICAWGRLGHWFGCRALRVPARHHHHGQGPDLRLRPDGRRDRDRPHGRALHGGQRTCSRTASRSAAIRSSAAIALANLDIFEREDLCGHVREKEGEFGRCSTACATCRSSATCAAPGYFYAIELVKDRDTKETFDDNESEELLRGFLSGELYKRGLICRADDRGDPVIQLSPPLIADTEEFEEIEASCGRC